MKLLFLSSVVVFEDGNGETTIIPKTNKEMVAKLVAETLSKYLNSKENLCKSIK